MPDHLWVPPSVRTFIRELADDKLRDAVNLAIMSLADDPVPPDAVVFRVAGEEIENAFELEVDLLMLYYSVEDEHVFVHKVDWRRA
jgi:hypothetical protein